MKNSRNFLPWSLATMMLLNSCNKVDRKEDERQIRELWTKACKYVCNGDWANYSECWDHSAKVQIIHSDQGEWLTG